MKKLTEEQRLKRYYLPELETLRTQMISTMTDKSLPISIRNKNLTTIFKRLRTIFKWSNDQFVDELYAAMNASDEEIAYEQKNNSNSKWKL